jgi:hypothetical protein
VPAIVRAARGRRLALRAPGELLRAGKTWRRGLSGATLALGRLGDLQRLLKLRRVDKLPPGKRDSWMFAGGTSLAYLVEPQFLERELIVLGRDNAGWSEAETKSSMYSVISRARDAQAGEMVEW